MLRARLTVEAPDIILNAAAYTAVDKAEGEEALARAINTDAVGVMAEIMAETGGKLVHVSTDFVFDGTLPRAYRPDDMRQPLSVYGRTKADGGRPAWGSRSSGPDGLGLRGWRRQFCAHNDPVDERARRIACRCRSDRLPDLGQRPCTHDMGSGRSRSDEVPFHPQRCRRREFGMIFAVAIAEEASALGLLRACRQNSPCFDSRLSDPGPPTGVFIAGFLGDPGNSER